MKAIFSISRVLQFPRISHSSLEKIAQKVNQTNQQKQSLKNVKRQQSNEDYNQTTANQDQVKIDQLENQLQKIKQTLSSSELQKREKDQTLLQERSKEMHHFIQQQKLLYPSDPQIQKQAEFKKLAEQDRNIALDEQNLDIPITQPQRGERFKKRVTENLALTVKQQDEIYKKPWYTMYLAQQPETVVQKIKEIEKRDEQELQKQLKKLDKVEERRKIKDSYKL